MMCSTLSTSTANCTTERQFRSAWTTTLATLRCTNTSPGAMSTIWFAGTRESEQPIHRYFGACCCERRMKNCASCVRTRSAQARLRSRRSVSTWSPKSLSRRVQLYTNVLGLGKEFQRVEAAFAADTGVLHAAERRTQIAPHPAVDPDDPRFELRRHAMRAREVHGPYGRGEAVIRRIRHRDRVVLAVERYQRCHGTEDLLAIRTAGRREALDHGRRDEPAAGAAAGHRDGFAAAEDRAAFLPSKRDVAHDFVEMGARDHGAEVGRGVARIADAKRTHFVHEAILELRIDRPLDQDPRAAQADLALVGECRAHERRPVRLGRFPVGEDERRILATHLERDLAETRCRSRGDRRARARGTRERDRL